MTFWMIELFFYIGDSTYLKDSAALTCSGEHQGTGLLNLSNNIVYVWNDLRLLLISLFQTYIQINICFIAKYFYTD